MQYVKNGNTGSMQSFLDVRRVEHHTDGGTECVGGQVRAEFRLDDTRVTVRACDASPDHPDLRALNLPLCPVNVGNALSEVELSLLLVSDTLKLNERGVGTGVALATLVRKDASPSVKPCGSHRRLS